MGDRLHALAKAGIVRPGRLVSHGHAPPADVFTRPPFAHPVGIHEMRDSFPLGRGRHHFFPKRSFNAALSSMASASNRFSRVFSSSSVFSRFASETSIRPNFAFHLEMLASLTPCLRHRSATETPASCSFKIPMICCSEK